MNIKVKKFTCFDVYSNTEGYSFIYAKFKNNDDYIDGLIDFILKEDNLLNYARRVNKEYFIGTPRQFAKLYRNISLFLNLDYEKISFADLNEETLSLFIDEFNLINDDGKLIIQQDKMGKIGEYTFHLLLTDYFGLDCILAKFQCLTDRNMSVFGIDTLFLDTKNKVIYFGESKLCKNIDNGIRLINYSLKDYENQINEEYRLVLSNEDAFKLSNQFKDLFGESTEKSVNGK